MYRDLHFHMVQVFEYVPEVAVETDCIAASDQIFGDAGSLGAH